ncbi:MAG TPA: IS21-like element helper ATPase IstB [Chitinophagaceae bacterium]|nr:IS21-like element helper ATPase IstB [Chitinophagaceae bacterium]
MNTTETLQQMQELKLAGMARSYRSQLALPINQQLEGHELIAHLLGEEKLHRTNDRLAMLLKTARLRFNASPEQIECSPSRNLTKAQWVTLLEGNYIAQGENILIVGSTGCGKSFLACALGHQACLMGIKTRYFNLNRLIEAIAMARTEGSYMTLINQLEKIPLIILDDFGLQSLNKNVKMALLQILEDRYEKKSLIITSQLPIAKWYEYIDEPTLADAIMDRMSAKCHRIELTGESRRKKK